MRLERAYWYLPFGTLDSAYIAFRRVSEEPMLTYSFKELDTELEQDQYYFGARYYDPAIGRFGSPDPIKSYTNPYSYVHNNPIMYIDPTGMGSKPGFQSSPQPEGEGWFGTQWLQDAFSWLQMMYNTPGEAVVSLVPGVALPLGVNVSSWQLLADESDEEELAEQEEQSDLWIIIVETAQGVDVIANTGQAFGLDAKYVGRFTTLVDVVLIVRDDAAIWSNEGLNVGEKFAGMALHTGMWYAENKIESTAGT